MRGSNLWVCIRYHHRRLPSIGLMLKPLSLQLPTSYSPGTVNRHRHIIREGLLRLTISSGKSSSSCLKTMLSDAANILASFWAFIFSLRFLISFSLTMHLSFYSTNYLDKTSISSWLAEKVSVLICSLRWYNLCHHPRRDKLYSVILHTYLSLFIKFFNKNNYEIKLSK